MLPSRRRTIGDVRHVISSTNDHAIPVVVELVEAANGALVWAEAFVQNRSDFPDLIGSLTNQIVPSVQMEVTAAEARRALAIPAQNLDA